MTVGELQQRVVAFRDERQWERFHSPKRVMESICIEAAELLETLQWSDDIRPEEIGQTTRTMIALEIADVAIYLLSLCAVLGIPLDVAIVEKLGINEEKYPC